MSRWWRFNLVGAAGVGVQIAVLAALRYCGLHYLEATVLAVESAVLHNFFWHRKWTWADRGLPSLAQSLARFHLLNGTVSLVGNFLIMWLLAGEMGIPPVPANLIAIALCAAANFMLADRLVFGVILSHHGLGDPYEKASFTVDLGTAGSGDALPLRAGFPSRFFGHLEPGCRQERFRADASQHFGKARD